MLNPEVKCIAITKSTCKGFIIKCILMFEDASHCLECVRTKNEESDGARRICMSTEIIAEPSNFLTFDI